MAGNRIGKYWGGATDGTFELLISDDHDHPAHVLSYRSRVGEWEFLAE